MNNYEMHRIRDIRLPFIFHISKTCLPNITRIYENWHENIEILLITSGKGRITLNTNEYFVSSGDIVVANSNVLHKIAPDVDTLVYHCLIVDRSFCLSNCFDSNELWFCERFRDERIEALMCSLALEFSRPEQAARDTVRIRSFVLDIMVCLLDNYCSENVEEHRDANLMKSLKKAIGYIRAEFTKDISLDDAAKFASLSKFYFAREFRKITGYTFVEYINILRCEKAEQMLLDQNLTVAQVGEACGFQNRGYFTKTFKKYMGHTPAECKKTKYQ